MIRYSLLVFGLTVFCVALIWQMGEGEAAQLTDDNPVLWADTSHINVGGSSEVAKPTEKGRDTFFKDVRSLQRTAYNIRSNYMEEVDTEEIIKAGIRGMLEDLDRFSVLMEKSSYDALMESTHGKYEGLGMQIDSRENRIVIISPIEGTPAYKKGLRAGDIIMSIDGTDTKGMTTTDGAKLMRGTAGTSVLLEIQRSGIADVMEFEVERAVIELKSVPYAGVVPGTDIGYVRLSRFAEETSHELREAINKLSSENISGLVFDLRGNGGGLLDQAKETAELFLKEHSEIVFTRGKYEDSERHLYSERPPLFPEKPLVILVNEGTASASEIVAGAVQDWDRGVIMGRTTYGKGLVQQIFPITSDNSLALKLTTARYFVPSGRCIQRPERQGKDAHTDDEEVMTDSIETVEKEVYYTNGGRIVYGGGGIVPDIEVEADFYEPIEINLERKSLFFDFAVDWVSKNPNTEASFTVTDEMVDEFREFIKTRDFDYKTSTQVALEDLTDAVNDEEKLDLFQPVLDSLKGLIAAEKADDFEASRDYIQRAIKREILSSIYGQRGVYEELILKTDPAVIRAIELLSQPNEYSTLITKGKEEASIN